MWDVFANQSEKFDSFVTPLLSLPCGKMAANRLKAITLAVIELKCHKNWKRPPFQCRFFFSGNVYLKLLWYTTKDQATEHKLDTIEITRIHFLMGKFVSKSVSK